MLRKKILTLLTGFVLTFGIFSSGVLEGADFSGRFFEIFPVMRVESVFAQSSQPEVREGFSDPGEENKSALGDDDGFWDDSVTKIMDIFGKNAGFRNFAETREANMSREAGLDNLTGVIYTAITLLKYLIGGIATLIIIISIVQMIASGTDKTEEEFDNVKKQFLYSIIAVVIMLTLETLFKQVFVVGNGNFLGSVTEAKNAAGIAARELKGIYSFIQAILGSLAVFMIVFAGFRLVTNAGNEEVVDKLKNQIIYATVGLLLVGISEFVVKDIIFVDGGQRFSVEAGKTLLVGLTNFISGLITFGAFISFVYAGYLYIASGVGEDNSGKVKNIIIAGVIGILIAAAAFAIVNTFVRLDTSSAPAFMQEQVEGM